MTQTVVPPVIVLRVAARYLEHYRDAIEQYSIQELPTLGDCERYRRSLITSVRLQLP
jgi:hypothetical protein